MIETVGRRSNARGDRARSHRPGHRPRRRDRPRRGRAQHRQPDNWAPSRTAARFTAMVVALLDSSAPARSSTAATPWPRTCCARTSWPAFTISALTLGHDLLPCAAPFRSAPRGAADRRTSARRPLSGHDPARMVQRVDDHTTLKSRYDAAVTGSPHRWQSSTCRRCTPMPPTSCSGLTAPRSGWLPEPAVRSVIEQVGAMPGYSGLLAYSLAEALFLARCGSSDDIVVAYPTVDSAAIADLASDESLTSAVTLMVDCSEHLDLIETAAGRAGRPAAGQIKVAIDVDASYRPRGSARIHLGVRRSPVRTAAEASALARDIQRRPGLRLDGVMVYEAQIAGVRPPARPPGEGGGDPGDAVPISSQAAQRRGEVVAASARRRPAVVNGGGDGQPRAQSAEEAVTEVAEAAACSSRTSSTPTPRSGHSRPLRSSRFPWSAGRAPGWATLFGGGYLASGPADPQRLPVVHLPQGLALSRHRGAGEVQTPCTGGPQTACASASLCRCVTPRPASWRNGSSGSTSSRATGSSAGLTYRGRASRPAEAHRPPGRPRRECSSGTAPHPARPRRADTGSMPVPTSRIHRSATLAGLPVRAVGRAVTIQAKGVLGRTARHSASRPARRPPPTPGPRWAPQGRGAQARSAALDRRRAVPLRPRRLVAARPRRPAGGQPGPAVRRGPPRAGGRARPGLARGVPRVRRAPDRGGLDRPGPSRGVVRRHATWRSRSSTRGWPMRSPATSARWR